MPQHVRPVAGLSVEEQVAYCAWLKGLSKAHARAEARLALERVDLIDEASTSSKRLSGGQLRRLGLAQALVGADGWLLLDEPTAGLDPDQRDRFARLIGGLEASLVVATHQVEDIGSLFDHVVLLLPETPPYSAPVAEFLELDASGRGDAVAAYRVARAISESHGTGNAL
jgi:ABC-type multidrug transport system ATPase subunit